MKSFIILLITSLIFTTKSFASNFANNESQFQDWSFHKTIRAGKEICYILSIPIASPKNIIRSKSFFIITNNNDDADEISTSSGYFYKENSNVELSFGSEKFYLFPYKNFAWANDKNQDIDIIKEMQKQDQMYITAISSNEKMTIDHYSLIGFTQAYNQMKKSCK